MQSMRREFEGISSQKAALYLLPKSSKVQRTHPADFIVSSSVPKKKAITARFEKRILSREIALSFGGDHIKFPSN
jgi:hypothetical protein